MNVIVKASLAVMLLVVGGSTTTYAQRCAGDLRYLLRNTKGELIEAEKIEIQSLRPPSKPGGSATYSDPHFLGPAHIARIPIDETVVQPDERTEWVKVLWIGTNCGRRLIELELEHENRKMVLRFHNMPAETNFYVDSIPYQEGTFEIDFKSEMDLKSQKLNREGVTSRDGKYLLRGTARTGLLVAAENWVKARANQ